MNVSGNIWDHIEVYDETGMLIASISDDEVIEKNNCEVRFCSSDIMFKDG